MLPPVGPILAALVNPALLWGGLAAVSVPVVIHLLARRRFRRVRWAAMAFLIDAEKRNRRRVRIEELILLALRCLAVFLLGALLARPFLAPSGIAAVLGGSERSERIFLIDDSFSMGYRGGGSTPLARAKESVANLVHRLRETAPGDTVTVLRASEPDAPLVAGALLDEKQLDQLLARLEAVDPTQRALAVAACLDALESLLEEETAAPSVALYVLSDFQRTDWAPARSAESAAGSIAAGLAAWADKGGKLRVLLVDVGDDAAQNLAITDLAPRQRQFVSGVEAALTAEISNFSVGTLPKLELDVAVGQQAAATVPVRDLSAGTRTEAVIPLVFPGAGDELVRVEIAPDDLPIDNARWLVAQVSDAVRVLVVNGEPSSDPYLDEVALLITALRPEGDVFSGIRVDVVDEAQLDSARFEDFHLVILCNLYRASEPVADALHEYVSEGGGLLIFPGDQVSDPVAYNATLYRAGAGLLPAALQASVAAPEAGVTLAETDGLHPVARVFSGKDNPFRERIHFTHYYELEPPPENDGVEPDSEGAAVRPAARVIARFNDASRSPAIVERALGAGRVMLFASSCDLEWNDWPRDPSFVVIVQELVQYLARASSAADSVRVGEPISLPMDPSRLEPVATLRLPGFPQQEEIEITASVSDQPGEPGTMRFFWPHTPQAGIYSLLLRERGGALLTRRVAVTLDPRESDLAPALEEDLRRAFGPVPVEYVAGVPARTDEGDEGRREIWPGLLVMALAVLMLEQFLAWRFGRG